jgi:hypothetical protein
MAGPFKGTFSFLELGFAWSESWYLSADSLQNAWDKMDAVAERRAETIGSGALLNAIRVTDTTTPRVALTKPVNYPGPPDSATTTIDTPYNGIYVKVQDTNRLYRRQMWLRGIPDTWIMYDQITKNPIINALATQAINRFNVRAIANQLLLKVITADLTANPRKTVANISLQAVSNLFLITAPGHGFATAQYVRVKNCKGSNLQVASGGVVRGVNGVWPVTVVSPDTFTIPLTGSPTNPPVYTGGGYAQARPIQYVPIRYVDYIRFAKRDTGNPSGRVRGRRRAPRQSQFTPAAGS